MQTPVFLVVARCVPHLYHPRVHAGVLMVMRVVIHSLGLQSLGNLLARSVPMYTPATRQHIPNAIPNFFNTFRRHICVASLEQLFMLARQILDGFKPKDGHYTSRPLSFTTYWNRSLTRTRYARLLVDVKCRIMVFRIRIRHPIDRTQQRRPVGVKISRFRGEDGNVHQYRSDIEQPMGLILCKVRGVFGVGGCVCKHAWVQLPSPASDAVNLDLAVLDELRATLQARGGT